MADLTVEELGMLDVVGTDTERRMVAEIKRHRAAQSAGREHVRQVVGCELRDWLPADELTDGQIARIADSVAEQVSAPEWRCIGNSNECAIRRQCTNKCGHKQIVDRLLGAKS